MQPSKIIDPYYREWGLKDSEIELRQAFARAYVATSRHPPYRNPVEAANKIGFRAPYDEQWALFFMRDGQTLRFIDEEHRIESEKVAKEADIDDNLVKAKMWELAMDGSGPAHASRVAALTQYA
jgi:hypothetical protein